MIISHKYKFIFIKTGKTAGTSIEVFLSGQCSERDILTPLGKPEENHMPRNYKGIWNPLNDLLEYGVDGTRTAFKHFFKNQKFFNHIPARRVRCRISSEVWNSYFKFCVERNPWDKTLSHYNMLKGRKNKLISFDDYINEKRFPVNFHRYTDRKGKVIVDKVLRYENLNEELREVFDKLKVPFNNGLEVRAKSGFRNKKIKYQEEYTSSQKKVVEEVFKDEIKLHGYNFD